MAALKADKAELVLLGKIYKETVFFIIMKPIYKLIKQKTYCCFPACISMILDRRKIRHAPQEEIGYYLGLIVPKEKAHLFTKVRTGRKPPAGYGTRVGKKKYSINNYFSKNKIKLKAKYYPLEKIISVKKFITEYLKNNNDIIVLFNNKKLFGTGNYGHTSLIHNIKNDIITLIDPKLPRKRKVKLSKLICTIKSHGKKKGGGFYLVSG